LIGFYFKVNKEMTGKWKIDIKNSTFGGSGFAGVACLVCSGSGFFVSGTFSA
jgi:hypothetical protein